RSSAGIEDIPDHAAKVANRKSGSGSIDWNDSSGMYQVVRLVVIHDLVIGIVDLRQPALIRVCLDNTGENYLLTALEHLLHERLVEPGPDQHAGLIRNQELEDSDPFALRLDHFSGNYFPRYGFIGAIGETADLSEVPPVLIAPGKIGQRVFDGRDPDLLQHFCAFWPDAFAVLYWRVELETALFLIPVILAPRGKGNAAHLLRLQLGRLLSLAN